MNVGDLSHTSPTEHNLAAAPAPTLFAGRYERLHPLGQGGAATVFAARDRLTGREVAVKFMRYGPALSPARAGLEIAVLRRLQRPELLPGVARLLDDGVEPDHAWLVMERVRGRVFPGVATPCAWATLRPVAVALLRTLANIHACGVLHLDLKPDNVLVDAEGSPVVVDFGIASAGSAHEPGLTDTVRGTRDYLAPERWTGASDARSDLYAVGVMLRRAMAREGAIDAETAPPAVISLIDRMTSDAPARRPASALDALAALGEGPPSLPPVVSAGAPRRVRRGETGARWLARARALAAEGALTEADALLRDAFRYALSPPRDDRLLDAVARCWLRVICAARDRGMTARLLYELSRAPSGSLDAVLLLARAFDAAVFWTPRALDAARLVPRMRQPSMEVLRWSVRVEAARKVSREALRAELAEATRAHRRSRSPLWRAALALWAGRLGYVEERYRAAATRYARAARGERWRSARINARLNAASAWMEAFAFERAMAEARRALEDAHPAGMGFWRARAEWIWRSAADRAGVALRPEVERVRAARYLDAPDVVLVLAVTEATIAFRVGDRAAFATLAAMAREACGLGHEALGIALVEAMEVSLGMAARTARHAQMPEALAARGVPRLALEYAALIAEPTPPSPERAAWLRALAKTVHRAHHDKCLGVLSVRACLARLGLGDGQV